MVFLASMDKSGLGTNINCKRSNEISKRLVELNIVEGYVLLGERYLSGKGDPVDYEKARNVFAKVADPRVPSFSKCEFLLGQN